MRRSQQINGERLIHCTIFERNISKFYYCYDYVHSRTVQRYIPHRKKKLLFMLRLLSSLHCLLFLLRLCFLSSFSVGKVKKHKFRWKCSCSQSSNGDGVNIRHTLHNHSVTASSTVWSRFSSFSVAICFPEINIFPTLIGVLFLNIMEKPEKLFLFLLFSSMSEVSEQVFIVRLFKTPRWMNGDVRRRDERNIFMLPFNRGSYFHFSWKIPRFYF